jgi:hypothetical protein
MLRSVPEAAQVAKTLGEALAEAARARTEPQDAFALSLDREPKSYAREPAAA